MTTDHSSSPSARDLSAHYDSGYEKSRLNTGPGRLERDRSRELLQRFLPPTPAKVADIGGGTGAYGIWLAEFGYSVHLVDIVPLHVEIARKESFRNSKTTLAGVEIADARKLPWPDQFFDAVLLLGPLYHLTNRGDRLQALSEAYRVLKSGGLLLAAGISRFASMLDGIRSEYLKDSRFVEIVEGDLRDGQHRNPSQNPAYFMNTFFHHPDELRQEVFESGFIDCQIIGIEGPAWLAPDFDSWWGHPIHRRTLLDLARRTESEPSLLGLSAHLWAVAKRSPDISNP